MKRYTRRHVLEMAASGAALAVAGCGGDGGGTSDGTATPAAQDSATRTPPATPAPSATPTAHPGVKAIERTSGEWEQFSFKPGDELPAQPAVYFMDVRSGLVEGWTRSAAAGEIGSHRALRGNRFVVGGSVSEGSYGLIDRETGAQWRWADEDMRLIAGERDALLFEETGPRTGTGPLGGSPTGRFHLVDEEMRPISAFEATPIAPEPYRQRDALFSPDSRWLLLRMPEGRDGPYALYLVEVATGTVQPLQRTEVPQLLDLGVALAGEGYVARVRDVGREISDVGGALTTRLYRWPASPAVAAISTTGYGECDVSPDGSLVALEQDLWPPEFSDWNLMVTRWPAIVFADSATQTRRFRLKGATLQYGDFLGGTRWLADSSGLVLRVAGDQYVIQPSDGGQPEQLPEAPRPVAQWFTRPAIAGPLPHPAMPNLFAYGRYALYDRETGAWTTIVLPNDGPTHQDPWNGATDEMVIATGHGGHDGALNPPLLQAVLEYPPFDDRLRFRVAGAETCLNLRHAPSLAAPVVDCLPDASVVEMATPPDAEPTPTPSGPPTPPAPGEAEPGHTFHYNWEDDIRYVHVRAPSGQTGWVAVQYLEWA